MIARGQRWLKSIASFNESKLLGSSFPLPAAVDVDAFLGAAQAVPADVVCGIIGFGLRDHVRVLAVAEFADDGVVR